MRFDVDLNNKDFVIRNKSSAKWNKEEISETSFCVSLEGKCLKA